MKGSAISADSDHSFELASVGTRQEAEQNYLKLDQGTTKDYDAYIDAETGKTIAKSQTYHKGYSGMAWYLNEEESLVPGAGGKLEFYFIARKEGISSVNISFDKKAYIQENGSVAASNDSTLQNLIRGHVLFFRYLDDKYGYHGWLGTDQKFKLDAPNNGTFQTDIPYKITVYWVWPREFRNYIYTQKSTQGDLFTGKFSEEKDDEYAAFINFINQQNTKEGSKLFYDKTGAGITIDGKIDKNMLQSALEAGTKYYNEADEYIGTNAKYIYVKVQAEDTEK